MKPSFWSGENIRSARKILKLSQSEFAKELGTSQQQLSEWEIGGYKPGKAYQKLLFITVDRLFEAQKNVSSSNEK